MRLPPEVYERSWALPRPAVFRTQADDVSARIVEMTMSNLQLGHRPTPHGSDFPSVSWLDLPQPEACRGVPRRAEACRGVPPSPATAPERVWRAGCPGAP
jgi:hypothetical protein